MRLHCGLFYLFMIGGLTLAHPQEARAGTDIPFTVTFSEPVTVTGCPANCPRLVLNVGGTPRYATYASGDGTTTLTFTYTTQPGDVDLDGITISSNQLDLNTSGTVKDLSGNDLSPATFTLPGTTGIKVDHPSLAMDFIANDYLLNSTHYTSLGSFLTAASGTFTRASVATYFDSSGVLQTASANTPRFDYDPVTHVAKGLLIEEARTNMLQRSAELDNAYWGKSNATISANTTISPDGLTTADKLVENAGTGNKEFNKCLTVTSGATYIASIFAKAGERTVVRFNSIAGSSRFTLTGSGSVIAGGSNTPSITTVGNGWYYLTIRFPASAVTECIYFTLINGGISNYTGDGASGAYAWGAQLELGSFPTSYIPTTTASITRQTDMLTVPTGTWYVAGTGTLMGRGIAASGSRASGDQTLMALDSGAFDGRYVRFSRTSGKISRGQISDTTTQFDMTSATWSDGSDAKIALAYALNSFGVSFNGNAALTGSSGTIPSLSRLILSGFGNDSGSLWSGTTKIIRYYPARVSNAQLQLLTQ